MHQPTSRGDFKAEEGTCAIIIVFCEVICMRLVFRSQVFKITKTSVKRVQTFDLKAGVIGAFYLLFTLAVAAHRPQVVEGPPHQDDEQTPEESDHGGGEESPPHPLAFGVTGYITGVGDDHSHVPNRGQIGHYWGEPLLITIIIFWFFSGKHRASFWRSLQRPAPDDQPCLAGQSPACAHSPPVALCALARCSVLRAVEKSFSKRTQTPTGNASSRL